MSGNSSNMENYTAASMWNMFNNTIKMMLENFEGREDRVCILANTILNSKEFADTLKPKINKSLSLAENKRNEKRYEAFCTWLLGILFYLLSSEKLSASHELFIKAQLKIMDHLRIRVPHIHFRMLTEYISGLNQICCYLKNQDNIEVEIKCFIPDDTVMEKEIADLTPVLIKLNSDVPVTNLQKNSVLLVTKIISSGVVCSPLLPAIEQAFDILFECLENNTTSSIYIVEFFYNVLQDYTPKHNDQNKLHDYVTRFILVLEQIVYRQYSEISYFDLNDSVVFENLLSNIIKTCVNNEIIIDTTISNKCAKICEYLLLQISDIDSETKTSFLTSICSDLRNIFQYSNVPYTNNNLFDKLIGVRVLEYAYPILEYVVIQEIKRYITLNNPQQVVVADVSEIWKKLHTCLQQNLDICTVRTLTMIGLQEKLNINKNILKSVRKIYFNIQEWHFKHFKQEISLLFLELTPFLIKCRQIKESYKLNINSTLNYLELLVESYEYLLPTIELSMNNVTQIEIMVYYIAFPFIGDVNFPFIDQALKVSLQNNLSGDTKLSKQTESLQRLSVCLSRCKNQEWKHFVCVRQWIKNIFLYAIKNNRIQVAKCLQHLISYWKDEDIITEILVPILNSDLLEYFGIIICQTIGEVSMVRRVNFENILYYDLYCTHCDFEYILEGKTYFPLNNKQSTQENYISKNILKYLVTTDVIVRRNITKLLPRLSRHISKFQTEEITKDWAKYILDDDLETRTNLGRVIRKTIQNTQNKQINIDLKNKLLSIVLNSLKENFTDMYLNRRDDYPFQETTLEVIKEVGHIKDDIVARDTYALLLIFVLISRTDVHRSAHAIMRKIAEAQNLKLSQIYTRYKKQYCHSIATMIIFNRLQFEEDLSSSLKRIEFPTEYSVQDFWSNDGHYLIPHFVESFAVLPPSRPLLDDLASMLMCEPADVLISYFGKIYPHVYLYANQNFDKCMKYIVTVTKTNISVLRHRSLQVIYNQLLMSFHDKRELVLKAIFDISKDSSEPTVLSSPTNLQEMADFLNPRFLGFLVYFDGKLVSSGLCEMVKMNVLLSLADMLKLMGSKYITPLRFKVLATLRTALTLKEEQYQGPTIDAWEVFVRCCDIESLGPLLSTIFISLLDLLKKFPQKIESIFRYLLIENRDKIIDYLDDLFFLQETNVSNEFKNIVDQNLSLYRSRTLLEQIGVYLKFLSHENHAVRVYALQFLKKLLSKKRFELNEIILGANGMNEIIVELIDTLMTGCRESDDKIKLACGELIGELGAIEPSHFPRRYTLTDSNFTFYITDDTFAVNALLELTRCFQVEKHTQNMNRYALAIQEMLKVYGVSPDENAPKYNLWNSFPETIKELILPLISSRYTMICEMSDRNINFHPIYRSKLCPSFKEWLFKWTCYLISLLKNDKKTLLQLCTPSLKQDQRALMFFLPHILVHAIIESEPGERNIIYEEFQAVLTSNKESTLDKYLVDYRPIPFVNSVSTTTETLSEDSKTDRSMKVIFVLLDYLDRWLREFESNINPKDPSTPVNNKHYRAIEEFMGLFCKFTVAQRNFQEQEYPRALLYLEKYISEDKSRLNDQLGFFVQIYAKLEVPDGVMGAMALQQTESTLENKIVAHGVLGQFQDMASCYDRMAQEQRLEPGCLREMARCYLELDNPYTAMNITEGVIMSLPDYKSWMQEAQAECYWRLNSYDELDKFLSQREVSQDTSWGVSIGRTLQHFRLGHRNEFRNEIRNITKSLTDLLTVTSIEEGVYRDGYPNVIKLHILNELQKAEEVLYEIIHSDDNNKSEEIINKLIEEWDLRLTTLQTSVRVLEPVLRLRRIILEHSQVLLKTDNFKNTLNKHIAKYWLKSAEIARQAGIFQQAYSYILKAETYKPKELFIEKAKHYWAREEKEQAFSTLKRGIEELFPDAASFKDMNPLLRRSDRKLCAEAKLLIATYNDETANVALEANSTNYKEAVEVYKEWEKSLVCLAQYYDKMFSNMDEEEKDTRGGEIQVHIINCFGRSLQYGSTFIHQSMPRMLSIWLDYGTRIIETKSTDDSTSKDIKKKTLVKMIQMMDNFLDQLPSYMFLSAFSQLVSRICHPVREMYTQIKSILIKLILKYPQQSLWMILVVSKSGYTMRTKRCQEVLQDQRLKNSKIIRLIYDFNRLAEKLIELCNKNIADGITVTSVNAIMRMLPRLLKSSDFSQIILPIQKLLKMVAPNPDFNSTEHDPFPNKYIYIVDIEDELSVLPSLQRPRRITFRGSDGKRYIHMLKPKDDLRKDSRLMEFNDVVNLYLMREPESRQRRLYIRTYSVVPLNEECGIIEWIDNLVGLRPILIKMYKQKGIFVGNRDLKTMMCSLREPLAKKRQIFQEKLLVRHPAILSEWFRQKFPDAHHWFQARTAYIRTCAAMSMVGYILGLGDRHGENILFDSTNGDVVHVDFNCLFNKGECFDWPELVPFRLTHNMVEAMGPLGVEGMFRKSAAVTLRVLRTHTNTLLSIVRPFVYDPLVSWPRNQAQRSEQAEAERTNELAFEHVKNIEHRLQGCYRSRGKVYQVALSCEGQANNLIAEATNIDKLAQMYIGWGPYL